MTLGEMPGMQEVTMEIPKKPSFKRLSQEKDQADMLVRPSSSYLKDALYNFKRDKLGIIGACIVVFMIFFGWVGPHFVPYGYEEVDLVNAFQPPSAQHWMGTDNLGRDLMVRVMCGARISLSVGFASTLISITIGIFFGAISGFIGGKTDLFMMRIVEIFSSIPSTLYIILLAQIWPEGGFANIIFVIGVTGWMGTARLVRGEVLSLKEREFVLAAEVSGVSGLRTITRHLIPNASAPIMVSLTLGIAGAIFTEAALRFLGIMSLGTPSWGLLVSDGIKNMRGYPHILLFPAFAISITILSFNFLADALSKALDPRRRQ